MNHQFNSQNILGIASAAGAIHPTKKDRDGEPLIDINKIKDYLGLLAKETVKESADRLGLLAEECRVSSKLLDEEMQAVAKALENSKDIRKDVIDTLRSMRTVATTEVAATLKPLADVRKFFLDDAHQTEIDRLKEFVELCERLQKLKNDGVLDAVADTILKLA